MKDAAKRWGMRLLKAALILGIFAFLFVQAYRNDAFSALLTQKKHWGFLLLGLLCNLTTVSITIVRWQMLVRAMAMPLALWDAFRIGFVGYLFNLAPAGIVSGDLIKVLMLAKQSPEMKEKGTASVIVDRVIGLYIMFLTAAGAILWTGFQNRPEPLAKLSTQIIFWLVIVSTIAAVAAMLPYTTRGRFRKRLAKLPWGGEFLVKLVEAFQLYRKRPGILFLAGLMTFPVHVFLALGIYFLAAGLFADVPAVMDFQVMHPVANLTSMIPLAAGPYEMVLDALFPLFLAPLDTPSADPRGIGLGLIVALTYRITCIVIACLGIVFYLAGRSEFDRARAAIDEREGFRQ